MFQVEQDKKPYEPKKEVKCPYWAETQLGRIVLVTEHNSSGQSAKAIVIRRWGDDDTYRVGYEMQGLELDRVTPLAEGESFVITNTWEIANG